MQTKTDEVIISPQSAVVSRQITDPNSDKKAAVTLLAGVLQPERETYPVFSPEAMEFLAAVSAEIGASELHSVSEIAAFGFWCRRAHLEALAKRHASPFPRLGRGLAFHIAPSNVPTMFAYS